jgi:oxaloacetate decarboxylase alpha subunit
LRELAGQRSISLEQGERQIDDVLTYALFPQVGLKFLENRGNPEAFEPAPGGGPPEKAAAAPARAAAGQAETYSVTVDGRPYSVEVAPGGEVTSIAPAAGAPAPPAPTAAASDLAAPLAGNIFKLHVAVGETVRAGDLVLVLEAMKMETEVRATDSGTISAIHVKEGDTVTVGDPLVSVA